MYLLEIVRLLQKVDKSTKQQGTLEFEMTKLKQTYFF